MTTIVEKKYKYLDTDDKELHLKHLVGLRQNAGVDKEKIDKVIREVLVNGRYEIDPENRKSNNWHAGKAFMDLFNVFNVNDNDKKLHFDAFLDQHLIGVRKDVNHWGDIIQDPEKGLRGGNKEMIVGGAVQALPPPEKLLVQKGAQAVERALGGLHAIAHFRQWQKGLLNEEDVYNEDFEVAKKWLDAPPEDIFNSKGQLVNKGRDQILEEHLQNQKEREDFIKEKQKEL
jgi:hypothetical protein